MFRITDGKPITLTAIMLGLIGAIFAIPVIFSLYAYHMNHAYAKPGSETLMPLVMMAVFGLVIVAVPVGWYFLGEFTYGRNPGPKDY